MEENVNGEDELIGFQTKNPITYSKFLESVIRASNSIAGQSTAQQPVHQDGYKCEICNKILATKQSRKTHLKNVHNKNEINGGHQARRGSAKRRRPLRSSVQHQRPVRLQNQSSITECVVVSDAETDTESEFMVPGECLDLAITNIKEEPSEIAISTNRSNLPIRSIFGPMRLNSSRHALRRL